MADAARDPEALEKEIEATRDELARTIDELVDRVNPKNVARRGVATLKEEAEHVVSALGGVVGGNEPQDDVPPRNITGAVLIGTGVVLAVTAVIMLSRRRKKHRR